MKHSHVPLQRHTLARSSTYTRVKQTVWEDSGLGTHSENIHAPTSYSLCAVLLLSPPPLRCQLKHTHSSIYAQRHMLFEDSPSWIQSAPGLRVHCLKSSLLRPIQSLSHMLSFHSFYSNAIVWACVCVSMQWVALGVCVWVGSPSWL